MTSKALNLVFLFVFKTIVKNLWTISRSFNLKFLKAYQIFICVLKIHVKF